MVLSVHFPTDLIMSIMMVSEGRLVHNILTANLFLSFKHGLLCARQIIHIEKLLSSRGILPGASLLSLLVSKAASACRALLE